MNDQTAAAVRDIHLREREFHDALSSPLAAASMPPREPDDLERRLLAKAGEVQGLHVLELGCGTGELTLQLLERGAHVTALDLSEGMVDITRRRITRFSPAKQAHFMVAAVENSGLSSGSFDLVVGKWILHHADVRGAADEISRVMRKGGRGIFVENSALNPLLALSRKYLVGRWGIPRYGTTDEHPLTARDLALFAARFPEVSVDFTEFYFLQLFDRQVLRFRYRTISRILRGLDKLAGCVPFLRPYSYHVILEMHN